MQLLQTKRLINLYYRLTVTQSQLVNLSILLVERELVCSITFVKVIHEFDSMKAIILALWCLSTARTFRKIAVHTYIAGDYDKKPAFFKVPTHCHKGMALDLDTELFYFPEI